MSKDDERFRNLIMFKMYATDDEIEDMMPAILVVAIIAVVLLVCFV